MVDPNAFCHIQMSCSEKIFKIHRSQEPNIISKQLLFLYTTFYGCQEDVFLFASNVFFAPPTTYAVVSMPHVFVHKMSLHVHLQKCSNTYLSINVFKIFFSSLLDLCSLMSQFSCCTWTITQEAIIQQQLDQDISRCKIPHTMLMKEDRFKRSRTTLWLVMVSNTSFFTFVIWKDFFGILFIESSLVSPSCKLFANAALPEGMEELNRFIHPRFNSSVETLWKFPFLKWKWLRIYTCLKHHFKLSVPMSVNVTTPLLCIIPIKPTTTQYSTYLLEFNPCYCFICSFWAWFVYCITIFNCFLNIFEEDVSISRCCVSRFTVWNSDSTKSQLNSSFESFLF